MSPYSKDTHSGPTINVNLESCGCAHRILGGLHADGCRATPVPIPCPVPPSVTFTVTLGECWGVGPGRCVSEDSAQRFRWTNRHSERCPARPIRVSCAISGKTWAESEVAEWESDTVPVPEFWGMDSHVRDLWGVVKALVLGKTFDHNEWDAAETVRGLFAQRDAVFSAICKMALAEDLAFEAQRTFVEACRIPFNSSEPYHESDSRNRPSTRFLAAYVEHLVEQVGVLP